MKGAMAMGIGDQFALIPSKAIRHWGKIRFRLELKMIL